MTESLSSGNVGGVAGDQRYEVGPDAVGERSYWSLDRALKRAESAGGNVISRYLVLPFLGSFFLLNPMSMTLGRFLPERYKPSYYASVAQMVHTNNGLFPHINPAELFIWLGIAQGITALGLNTGELAIRYLLVGAVLNFIGGWVTDLTTMYVSKQQGIVLSNKVVA